MKIERLTLRNFRNIEECTLYPDPRLNFLVGSNGQGKTSILEALGYLALLRSFRGSKTTEVIRYQNEESEIHGVLSSKGEDGSDWKTDLKLFFSIADSKRQKAKKLAFINGKPFKSSTQYLSQRFGSYELGFHTIVFNPSDHELVRGEPSLRRIFLDRILAAEDSDYLKISQKFQRTLEQRNSVLKQSESPNFELLGGFTEPFVRYASQITLKRLKYLERLNLKLNKIVHQLVPNHSPLRVIYLSNWVSPIADLCIPNNNLGELHFTGQGQLPSLELLEQTFWNKLSTLGLAEWKVRHSLVGPQRDDWTFYLGNQILKGHGSQGEVRSALLALKLAEVELFRNQTGHRPVFLLDDFSSELDRERRSFLLRFLNDTDLQVFVTSTEESVEVGKRYWISNGSLKESGHDHARKQSEPRAI